MRLIGRVGRLLAMLGWSVAAIADDRPADPDVDRVLGEWHRRASSITSIEAKFRRTDERGDLVPKRSRGTLILAAPDLAVLDTTTLDHSGGPTPSREMHLWTGREYLRFDFEARLADRITPSAGWTGVPLPLAIPFLFRLDPGRAREKCDWKVLVDRPDKVWLEARAKAGKGSPRSGRFLIELDKKDYLPRKVILADEAGSTRETYEIDGIKTNSPVDLEDLKNPCLDAWTVRESGGRLVDWFLR